MKRFPSLLLTSIALLLTVLHPVAVSRALAALAEVGPAVDPHGYPQYYGDANGLRLQLCQDGDGVNGLCIFDPIEPGNPESVALGVGDESFWWMATGFINDNVADVPDPLGVDAEVVLALEGAFGGIGVASDGDQIAFGRIRIRIDTPVAGTYIVTHPYGVEVFENVPAGTRAINFTKDIGAINVFDPAAGFAGALRAQIGPFLTWPGYQLEPTLQVLVLDGAGVPTGEILQYIGDPAVPHRVTGSTFTEPGAAGPANYFRVQGPDGIDVRTELFEVMGKVLPEPPPEATAHLFPPPPPQNLFATGPVNRAEPFLEPTTGTVTGFEVPGYAVGFPLWYQENAGTAEEPAGGLRLAVCPPLDRDPMCISAEIDPADPAAQRLGVGEEAFWWSAGAFINEDTDDVVDLPAGLDGELTLALEAAFGGTGAINDGDQIAFGRVRVRVDVPTDGTYTITHPYGIEVIENVTTEEGINFTRDLGVTNPADPDGGFVGALYSDIGPRLLTWPDYQLDASLQVGGNQYVGDPAVPHDVTGSTFIPEGETEPANYFRIQGPEIDVRTSLFAVSGKVFAPASVPAQLCTFRQGRWYLDNGNGLWQAGIDIVFQNFGAPGDIPVAGDWDGDGQRQIGVFRNGTWYLDANDNGIWEPATDTVIASFGAAGDKPVTGDWNGDGTDQIGVFRNGKWYLDADGDGAWSAAADTTHAAFGTTGDIPVAGDWNIDGTDQIGVYRNGAWYLDADGNGAWDPLVDTVHAAFGAAGDKPVIGDWNVDGTDQIGVFRNGAWYLDADGDGAWNPAIDTVYQSFGAAGDVPLVCGDGGEAGIGGAVGVQPPVAAPAPPAETTPPIESAALAQSVSLQAEGFIASLAIDGSGTPASAGEDVICTFRQGRWFVDNGTGAWEAASDTIYQSFGAPGDIPVAGDWDGNGIKQVGVFRNGAWYLDANDNGVWDAGIDTVHAVFGTAGDKPVIGDWDGNGTDQIGVFRNGAWYLDANGNGAWNAGTDTVHATFGTAGDKPVTGDWNGGGTDQIGVFRNGAWYFDANGNGAWNAGIDIVYQSFGAASDIPLICSAGGGGGGQPVVDLVFQTSLLPPLLEGGFSAAVAVNAGGTVAGLSEDAVGLKAVRWAGASATLLEPFAGFDYSAAYGIDNSGTAVGESDNGDAIEAAYWAPGATTATALSTSGLSVGPSSAYAINDLGEIVGEGVGDSADATVAVYWANTGADPDILPNLAVDGFSSAYAISTEGLIVGESLNGDGEVQAVLWQAGAGGSFGAPLPLPELSPVQVASLALGIDDSGRIVGEAELADGSVHGVIWTLNAQRTSVALTQDLGTGTSAQAINDVNRIAGMTAPGSGSDLATLWNGASFTDSQELANAFSQAYAVNDSNQVVGIAGNQAFIATPQ